MGNRQETADGFVVHRVRPLLPGVDGFFHWKLLNGNRQCDGKGIIEAASDENAVYFGVGSMTKSSGL